MRLQRKSTSFKKRESTTCRQRSRRWMKSSRPIHRQQTCRERSNVIQTIDKRRSAIDRDGSGNAILRVGYTPDSDDVINFYAWEQGRLTLSGWQATFDRDCIASLNRAAEAQLYDVVSISSVCYPRIAQNYWILSAGSSVGRGYGPVLVAKDPTPIDALCGKQIAVGGINTSGAALAKMYCPGAELVEMRYDQIADAVLGGLVDAGVMIHEELLYFTQKGLCECAIWAAMVRGNRRAAAGWVERGPQAGGAGNRACDQFDLPPIVAMGPGSSRRGDGVRHDLRPWMHASVCRDVQQLRHALHAGRREARAGPGLCPVRSDWHCPGVDGIRGDS